MKRILCYGDSNTWGYTPGTAQRYPQDVRWTGRLAAALGPEYQIIEAGLNGRTTVFPDPFNPYLNGLTTLPMELLQNAPLDLIILSLGTNDLKFADARNSARGVGKLMEACNLANTAYAASVPVFPQGPKILVVSPIEVHPCTFTVNPYTSLRNDSVEESRKYPNFVKYYANLHGAGYFNAASVAEPSPIDGVHMSPESHAALAQALTGIVREMLE